MAGGRGVRENFARFFEEPTREGLREVLRNHVGEADELDFKREWPEQSKLAKHVLGLANFGSGGCIVAGVNQGDGGSLDPVGIPALKDKTALLGGIAPFLPNELAAQLEVLDFPFEDSEYPTLKGKAFQVLFVPDDPGHLPFLATKAGDQVNANFVYTRRNTGTEPANNAELQRIISRRLESGYSSRRELDLREHLEQLRVLYEQTGRPDPGGTGNGAAALLSWALFGQDAAQKVIESSPESFGQFLAQVIKEKKRRIEAELDLL